jgi:CTP synthase
MVRPKRQSPAVSRVCVRVCSQIDLNAFASGEVYVLNDGGEVDLDLGNYERYLNVTLSRDNNITTGKIYREVIEKEVRLLGSIADNVVKMYFHLSEEANIWARLSRSVPN